MGSDDAPAVEVEGALRALDELGSDVHIVFVGDRELIEAELDRHPEADRSRIEIEHAPDRIGMGDSAAQAIRRKPDSSIVVGLNLHKRGEADAFISAGSTGAVMAGSLFILRPLAGVDRPPVGTIFPTENGHTLLLDAGANVNTRPKHLVQFAYLGSIYAHDLMECERPRVGLLNIGEEPGKGNDLTLETYALLSAADGLHFVGNVEGRDIISGKCDVLVCDGFVGNVVLKFYESVADYLVRLIRAEATEEGVELGIENVERTMDWTEYGGAPLLGVNGVSIICHGGSPPRAIRNAIRVAVQAVERGMVTHMEKQFARLVPTTS